MPYQVLARKYRPLRFRDVAGQDHVTRTLQNALEQGRVAHGYIFSGHRGIGKTTIARILASALNCQRTIGSPERPTPEPCLQCDSCLEIRQGNAVDVIEIDAATNRGIDEIRELRDAARYRPARDRFKIYILDEAHQITDAAFNALLKTLEEPPEHIVFMMATTEPENIPQTIRSRCQHFSFHAVKLDDILGQLRKISIDENVIADDAALDLLAEAGDGSMRDALSIMDQAIASAPVVQENGPNGSIAKPQLSAAEIRDLMGTVPNTVFEEILEHVSANGAAGVLTTANRLLDAGNSPAQIARQFVRYLRNCVVAKIANLTPDSPDTELLQISPDERRRAARTALLFTEEELTRFLQVMLRTFDDLGFRQEQRFHLELGLLKLVHLQRLLPMEHFLSQLPRPDPNRRTASPTPAPRTPNATPAPRTTTQTASSKTDASAPPSAQPKVGSTPQPSESSTTDASAPPSAQPKVGSSPQSSESSTTAPATQLQPTDTTPAFPPEHERSAPPSAQPKVGSTPRTPEASDPPGTHNNTAPEAATPPNPVQANAVSTSAPAAIPAQPPATIPAPAPAAIPAQPSAAISAQPPTASLTSSPATNLSFRPEDAQLHRASAVEKPASRREAPVAQSAIPAISVNPFGTTPSPNQSPERREAEQTSYPERQTDSERTSDPAQHNFSEGPGFSPLIPTQPKTGALAPETTTPHNVSPLTQPDAETHPDPSTGIDPHLPPIDAYELDAFTAAAGNDDEPPPPPPDPEAQPAPQLGTEATALQAAAVEALFATGSQNSAAEQLEETTWAIADGEIRIQTSLSKPLMNTIFRADTLALIRGAIANHGGAGLKLTFLPGNTADKPKAPRKPRTGSAQAKALEHPTVQAAQRLFNAEITNVFDLRKD